MIMPVLFFVSSPLSFEFMSFDDAVIASILELSSPVLFPAAEFTSGKGDNSLSVQRVPFIIR